MNLRMNLVARSLFVVVFIAGSSLLGIVPSVVAPHAASASGGSWQYYKVDPHAHSVLSGDSVQDLGIMAEATKARGFDGIFVTDHTATSNNPIGGVIANHVVFDDSLMQWTTDVSGTPTQVVAETVNTPVSVGTSAFHVRASSATSGESFAWIKRGPNFRSGTITLRFAVRPTAISANSGLYVSASIGGDDSVDGRPPDGYTTANGVVSPGKSTVFVWQLGNARTPSSDPNRRVLTYNLPYTLNEWNTYTINVTQALNDVPAADRPLTQNALQYIKMTANAANGGSAEGYFDDFHIDAQGIPAGQEFVDRNALIGTYNTPTYQQFASQEVGFSDHAQMFKFDITDPAQYSVNKKGALAMPIIQATGYPAQLNHPAWPGGVTEQEALDNLAYGAEMMETVPRGQEDTRMIRIWDEIMNLSGEPLMGTWTSDSHRTASFGPATYLYSPARGFDPFMRTMFEGRSYLAYDDFPGRVELRLDNNAGPYPSRYPVFVRDTTEFVTPTLQVTAGLVPGDSVVWIRNGVEYATAPVVGSSYTETRPISLMPGTTFVRVEVRNSLGEIKAMTQPLFIKKIASLPTGVALHAEGVSTPTGAGYIRANVKGITAVAFNAGTQTAMYSLDNPVGSLTELRGRTGSWDIASIRVGGTPITPAASASAYDAATGSTWWYDAATRTLSVKALQPSAQTSVAVVVQPGNDTTAPSAPADLNGVAENATQVTLQWTAASDDVGVAHYRVRRDGTLLTQTDGSTFSIVDTSMPSGTTYAYSVEAIDAVGHVGPAATVNVFVPLITTTIVSAIADSYVSASTPTTNYGTNTAVRIDGSPILNSYLRFSPPALPGAVFGLRLELFGTSVGSSGYRVHTTTSGWTENGLTFNNAPPLSGVVASSGPVAANQWASVNLAGVLTPAATANLGISTAGSAAIAFSSRQGTNAPRLVIDSSPTAPTAANVSATGAEDTNIAWTPVVNDADGSSLTCAIYSPSSVGVASVAPNCASGSFSPEPNFNGTASFVYSVSDGTSTRRANVTITVTPVNDPPEVADDLGNPEAFEDTPVTLSFDFQDPDGDCPLSFATTVSPDHGVLGSYQPGACQNGQQSVDVTYFPDPDYFGSESFSFVAKDPSNATSNEVQSDLFVSPVADPPVASPGAIVTPANTPKTWLPNVHDADGDTLTCSISIPASKGTATVASNCSGGTYTPSLGASGSDQFAFSVSDGTATSSATMSVSITGGNSAPSANDLSVSGNEDSVTPWIPSVSDPESDTLTCSIAAQGAHGTAAVAADCSGGTYTPVGNYNGPDSFQYHVSDGALGDDGTVSVTVGAVNDGPTASPLSFTTNEDTQALWTPIAADIDSSALTCSILSGATKGTATVASNCASGNYTPSLDQNGSDSFTYQVSDGQFTAVATVSVTITPVNDAPSVAPASTVTSQPATVPITISAIDPDGDCPLAFVAGSAAHGTVSGPFNVGCSAGVASAVFRYTPSASYSGPDAFNVTATDGSGAPSTPRAVSITVGPALYADGYENGTLAGWQTVKSMMVQQSPVKNGFFAVEGGGTSSYLRRQLTADVATVTLSTWVYPTDVSVGSIGLLGVRDTANNALLQLQVKPETLQLRARNEITNQTFTSATVVPLNTWTRVQLTATIAGATSSYSVRVNGTLLSDLGQATANLGSSLIRYLQLGHNSIGTYHWYLDDFLATSP